MSEILQQINSPDQMAFLAQQLRDATRENPITSRAAIEVFERWAGSLDAPEVRAIPGVPFLRLWLRRGTLEPILCRELGPGAVDGKWWSEGRAMLRAFPLGVIGHWPAGNIEIQPILSLTCGLLGGNACLVRVPTGLVESIRLIVKRLESVDRDGLLIDRICLVNFDHSRIDLQEAMARNVDGAMVWGGEEAIGQARALPFPHWAHVVTFGPRLSVAAIECSAWSDPSQRSAVCRRIARDVWQFDQQACSSPQTLFLEQGEGRDSSEFVRELKSAFEEENRAHPRQEIEPAATSAICRARASWLLADVENRAIFPSTPDWTILFGRGSDIPKPTQSRVLAVLAVNDLSEAVAKFDGSVQTLGLAVKDPQKEAALTQLAGQRGVDRIVKLGQMHVFGSPWDGMDLIRPMVRFVRRAAANDQSETVNYAYR